MNALKAVVREYSRENASIEDLDRDFRASARTSIYRKKASAPLRVLLNKGLVRGSVLNFGKGRCNVDSNAITNEAPGKNCTDYDYTWCRTDIFGRHFDTVYCSYVMNTLPPQSRDVVWRQVANATRRDGGVAFIAVRSDKDRGIKGTPLFDGVKTSIGTFQVGYSSEKIRQEALRFFREVEEIPGASGYKLIRCNH
ncbi:TPA: hypothetical protein I7682_18110 [Vibrio vulnificus]|nr:hypothetical protein [Vibrio vulnificus]